jgi:hypothetical protein
LEHIARFLAWGAERVAGINSATSINAANPNTAPQNTNETSRGKALKAARKK